MRRLPHAAFPLSQETLSPTGGRTTRNRPRGAASLLPLLKTLRQRARLKLSNLGTTYSRQLVGHSRLLLRARPQSARNRSYLDGGAACVPQDWSRLHRTCRSPQVRRLRPHRARHPVLQQIADQRRRGALQRAAGRRSTGALQQTAGRRSTGALQETAGRRSRRVASKRAAPMHRCSRM